MTTITEEGLAAALQPVLDETDDALTVAHAALAASGHTALLSQSFREIFEKSYSEWRSELVDGEVDGLPVAPWSGDDLLQKISLALAALSRPLP